NVVNPSVAKIMTVVQQSLKNIEEKYGTLSIVEEDNEADRENKVMVETLPKPSAAIQNWSHPDFPSTEPLLKPSVVSLAVIGLTKEEAIKPDIGNKENGMDISERAPREQTNKDNVNYVDGTQEKNTSVKMSALGIGEDEEAESPWDSEDSSTSLPINYVDDLPGAADQRGKNIQNEQVADSLENFPHLKPTIEVKDSVPNKAVEMKGTQSSRSDSSHLDSASLPLNHETRRGPGDLKVHNKLPFLLQLMTAKHSASTDIRHMTLTDKCKTNIRAVFLRGDQRLHDLRESQRPENRESKE
ncbi:ankyrin repeat domain-containing protein 26-like, partial [Pteropus medius]|uniref:ankyrin repeat domain-containing protein 26-like n=1 Tax=Pteropus vampyrus TaxID=132908 RepID=UPI00196B1D02